MMMRLLILLLFIPVISYGQNKHTLSGRISDSETGESLIGVTVVIPELVTGTASNTYGFYSITLPANRYSVRISFVGYEDEELSVDLNADITLDIALMPRVTNIDEVVISAEKANRNITDPSIGIEKLNLNFIENVPVFFGEKDILKTIQLLPGISTASEGGTGFNVRGGSIGNNLILLDEAPVYSSAHLLGFFSVFNSDAIKDVTIYKGGIPAEFGGRASSVLDIKMNDGNNQRVSASGGIGVVASSLTLEVPVIKEKMSFIISGRRTYADIGAKLLLPENLISDDTQFYFYDLNAKINLTINDKNRIFLSGFFGKDLFELGSDVGTAWDNTTGTLRWNHLFSNKIFSNTSLVYSKYDYGFVFGGAGLRLKSGVEDLSFKENLTWYINPNNTLKFGLDVIYHQFNPGEVTAGSLSYYSTIRSVKYGVENAIYMQNEQHISEKLSANYGLRLSGFFQTGPSWFYEYGQTEDPVDSTFIDKGQIAYPDFNFEPRVTLNYITGDNSSFKISYNRIAQYIHLLSNTTSGSPTDVWIPGSKNIKPLLSNQFSAGLFQNFNDNSIETSIELYYKRIRNAHDYMDGADIIFNEHFESQILTGSGRSYGIELYLKKKYGRFNGWISYSLSRTENKINGINGNMWYPVRYDKTHDFALVSIYNISRRLSASAVWVYASGNAVTFPDGMYQINNISVPYYTERNGYRMPSYHRLDLSFTIKSKERKRFRSAWDFSVYNAYNRHNAYMISFRESETIPGKTEAVRLSLFGIIPSITYKFNFTGK